MLTVGNYRVYVWAEEGGKHHRPHCHVFWPDGRCVVAIDTVEILAGTPSSRAVQIVSAHLDIIRAEWARLNP